MNPRLKVLLLFLFINVGLSCGKGNSGGGGGNPPIVDPPLNTFTNPLLTSGPDPWVIKKDNFYYYTHTLGNRISVWKTPKMTDLKNAPVQTIWSAPATGPNSRNVWAPELHFINNAWYAYYTAGASADLNTQRTFVLENTNADPLAGTWTDKGQIKDAAADEWAIDGTILTYNSKNYFIWSGHATNSDNTQRLYIARMSNPWTLETGRVLISSPTNSWETIGAPVNEGPEILKGPTGKIFLIYSASGCWMDDYALGMLTLKDNGDPLNPADWMKTPSPVFARKTDGVFGPGHNTFFKSVDGTEDWILYHANTSPGQGCADFRNPRMQKFTWNADGTPNFGTPVSITTAITKPAGE